MSRPGEVCGIWQLFVEQGRTPVLCDSPRASGCTVMEVIRHAELIVEWFLWTIEHTNRSLDNSNATFRPSRAASGIQCTCMPDAARDGRNVAFELSSDLLVCSIVQRNHSTSFWL